MKNEEIKVGQKVINIKSFCFCLDREEFTIKEICMNSVIFMIRDINKDRGLHLFENNLKESFEIYP
jgi:hypothetical protein